MAKKINISEKGGPSAPGKNMGPGLANCGYKPEPEQRLNKGIQRTLDWNLLWAARKQEWKKMEGLLDEGAKADSRDKFLYSALTYAACEGQIALVKKIIGAGTGVSLGDAASRTAYMAATVNGHTEIAELLLEHGKLDVEPNGSGSGGAWVIPVVFGGCVVAYELGVDTMDLLMAEFLIGK